MPIEPTDAWSWADQFRSFTTFHALVFAGALGLIVASAALGRRWRGTKKETRLRLTWAVFTIAWQAFAVVWWLLPANFDPSTSFPIHLCDLAAWVVPVALLCNARFPRALLYFWGVGLSTQAFFTPVLQSGWATYEFWLFWVGHLHIVGSAVYVVAVLGAGPTIGDWLRVMALNVAVLGLVILANQAVIPWACGCEPTNYWYVGQSGTEARTIVDALGPWPGRIAWIALLATAAQLIAWAPWAIARRARSSGRAVALADSMDP